MFSVQSFKRSCGLYFQHITTEIQRKQNLKPQIDTFISFSIFCLESWTLSCLEILLSMMKWKAMASKILLPRHLFSLNLDEIKNDGIEMESL